MAGMDSIKTNTQSTISNGVSFKVATPPPVATTTAASTPAVRDSIQFSTSDEKLMQVLRNKYGDKIPNYKEYTPGALKYSYQNLGLALAQQTEIKSILEKYDAAKTDAEKLAVITENDSNAPAAPAATDPAPAVVQPAAAGTAPLPSSTVQETPQIASCNTGKAQPDISDVDGILAKNYENGNITIPAGTVKQQADGLAADIEDKRAAKAKLEDSYDYRINSEGDAYLAEYTKQRKDKLVEDANEALKVANKEGITQIYKDFGDPAKDYAKDSVKVDKLNNILFNEAYEKFKNSDRGLNIATTDTVSDLSARSFLANGMEDLCKKEIRALGETKGNLTPDAGETAASFNKKRDALQARITELRNKGNEITVQKKAIATAMDAKKDARQKKIDALVNQDDKVSQDIITKRNGAIKAIPDEPELLAAKAAIKAGTIGSIKSPVLEKIKDVDLLTRHTTEMKKLTSEKRAASGNAQEIIDAFEGEKAVKDAQVKVNPNAKGETTSKAPAGLGDNIGKIVGAVAQLGAMAMQFQNLKAMGDAANIAGMNMSLGLTGQVINVPTIKVNENIATTMEGYKDTIVSNINNPVTATPGSSILKSTPALTGKTPTENVAIFKGGVFKASQ